MPEPSTQSARIIFGPRVQSLQEGVDDAPVQITKGTCKHNSIIELQDITHLQVTIHASCPETFSSDEHCIDISRLPLLRSLAVDVVYDTLADTSVVHVWTGILAVIRSIPETSQLERVTLCSPVSRAVLRSAWSRSTLVRALERPLYSVDWCLVKLVDRAQLRAVTLVPPSGEEFMSSDWVRVRAFFPALWDYGMLHF